MNDELKQKLNERYEHELNKGERFWPDSIFKDLIVSLGIFIVLILLATFIGVAPNLKLIPQTHPTCRARNGTFFFSLSSWRFMDRSR